ncbi:MAG: disulfide bond formation protein DsbA [Actinomycetia bacterium]|nr:disulfide bond formation protein DsbA [Actinomycetes bacterium]MCP4961616.1 disulfide bond formation protein DsbA [Actinomycetes bacterium]
MNNRQLEVFADISCPFTHVGLKKVVGELDHLEHEVDVVVRAWPLEWVNGEVFPPDVMRVKVDAIGGHLGAEYFAGFDEQTWPNTTLGALNLAAKAYEVGITKGLAVSLALREAVFEQGLDIGRPEVLAEIASEFALEAPSSEASAAVTADYEEGQRRSVKGSPEFWIDGQAFFCPSLTIGHDDDGLTAEFDPSGIDTLLSALR